MVVSKGDLASWANDNLTNVIKAKRMVVFKFHDENIIFLKIVFFKQPVHY